MRPRVRPHLQSERGAVLLWASVLLAAMLGLVAIVLDVAKLAATRTRLQSAADAAALAGAMAIDPDDGTLRPDSAIARAQHVAALNRAFVNGPEPVDLRAEDVSFPAPSRIRVVVRRAPGDGTAMVARIARMLGVLDPGATASATAVVAPAGQVFCGLLPLWASPPGGEARFEAGCGTVYVLREGGDPAHAACGALNYPACGGGPCASLPQQEAATFTCLIESGYCCAIDRGQVLQRWPGHLADPLRKGVAGRFSRDTDGREGICYAEYRGNGERVILVPVTTRPADQRASVTVTGFSAFFVHRIPSSGEDTELVGEFLYDVVPGTPLSDGHGFASGGTVFAVRLVR